MNDIDRAYFKKVEEIGLKLFNDHITRDEHTQAIMDLHKEFSAQYPNHPFSLYWITHPYEPPQIRV